MIDSCVGEKVGLIRAFQYVDNMLPEDMKADFKNCFENTHYIEPDFENKLLYNIYKGLREMAAGSEVRTKGFTPQETENSKNDNQNLQFNLCDDSATIIPAGHTAIHSHIITSIDISSANKKVPSTTTSDCNSTNLLPSTPTGT